MTDAYIDAHYDDILAHSSDIEHRLDDSFYTAGQMKRANHFYMNGCTREQLQLTLITDSYEFAIAPLVE